MVTHDNGGYDREWSVPPARHCGEFCLDITCHICGEYIQQPPPNAVLGEN